MDKRTVSHRCRWIMAILPVFAVAVVIVLAISRFVASSDYFNYYGKCNRVVARLEAMPGVDVVEVRMHKDVILEDFFVTLEVHGVHRVKLEFVDSNREQWFEQAERWGEDVLPTFEPESE